MSPMSILQAATSHLADELHRHYFEEVDRLWEVWQGEDGRVAVEGLKYVHQCAFEYATAKTLGGRHVPALDDIEERLARDLFARLTARVV